MRGALIIGAAAALFIAGCSSSGTATAPVTYHPPVLNATIPHRPSATHSEAPHPAVHVCRMRSTRDVILYEKFPGQPAETAVVGDVELSSCRHTYSAAFLTSLAPPGSQNYCIVAAFKSQNPGWRAPQFPRVVAGEVGFGC